MGSDCISSWSLLIFLLFRLRVSSDIVWGTTLWSSFETQSYCNDNSYNDQQLIRLPFDEKIVKQISSCCFEIIYQTLCYVTFCFQYIKAGPYSPYQIFLAVHYKSYVYILNTINHACYGQYCIPNIIPHILTKCIVNSMLMHERLASQGCL